MDLSIRRRNATQKGSAWLRSQHGTDSARPVTLKAEAFTDKLVPSGQPLAKDDDLAVPFTGAAGQKLIGHLLDAAGLDVTNGNASGALLSHGVVITAEVPGDFTPPADYAGLIEYI